MQLLRNRRTGLAFLVSEKEAMLLSDPDLFKDWMNNLLSNKKYDDSIDLFVAMEQKMMFRTTHGEVAVLDILNGQFEIIPNTRASRILYGVKDPI